MKFIKVVKTAGIILFFAVIVYGIYYLWFSLPIITGYASKNAASGVFVAHRSLESLQSEDLAFFPISLAHVTTDFKDSSVTASILGLAKRKTIYRKGLGCTTINDYSEEEVSAQHINLSSSPSTQMDSIPWPQGDLVKDTLPAGTNSEMLHNAVQSIFTEQDTTHKLYTRAVIVVYDNKLVAEQYAPGFDMHSKQLGWSMSKSIISALTGILVREGKLNIDIPAPVPEWQKPDDPRHAITIKNILQQRTGLDFVEDYTKLCDATRMLFEKGDMAAYTASQPLRNPPGKEFYYSSGNTNVLSRIIRQTLGDQFYYSFPNDSLFYKIGAYSFVMEPDASGTFVGSSYTYATARDWARFGLLYYNKGVCNGQRILSEDWVEKSHTPSQLSDTKEYGFMFWLNGFNPADISVHRYPDVPADMYCAAGYGGQKVFIIPSKKLVVVRLGLYPCNENMFLKNIIAALPE